MKYLIRARLEVDGRVEKHDVIGAIFGQTEGLLGSEFNLEELQEKDKIGRVQVDIKYQGTKTVGSVQVSSNLDRVETSILASMLEIVDRIGPYNARITVEEIKDLRSEKLKSIIERSRELLKRLKEREPDVREIVRQIEREYVRVPKVVEYGKDKLPAGPGVDASEMVIIVEGRADVINLLRYGYTNVIALNGAREEVPDTIRELAEKKKTILFVDGDRGGELILKSVLSQLKIDYVARAPPGKEVENLTGKEIAQALSEGVEAVEEVKPAVETQGVEAVEEAVEVEEEEAAEEKPPEAVTVAVPEKVLEEIERLKGTLEGVLYDSDWNEISRIKVRDLYSTIQEAEPGKIYALVFDGIITQRILEAASDKKIEVVIGARVGSKISHTPGEVKFLTFSDLT